MKRRTQKALLSDDQRTVTVGASSEEALNAAWADWHKKTFCSQRPPPGAITAVEYAELVTEQDRPMSQQNAARFLARAETRGELKSDVFTGPGKDGKVRQQRYWWRVSRT